MNEPKLRFKADDGSEFPEWEEKKLGEVGDIVTGNTPSTKQNDYYGECYLWVTPTDITDSREVTSTAKMLTELGYTVARHIPANSILVTCIASIGKNAILRENGSCNQQINSITPYDEYSVEFVYYLICQNEKLLHANAGTGGMEILNKENFSKIKMYFPCLAEQQKIAEFLSTIDTVIEKQKETVSVLEERKKGVMQKLFSQEVRFKADDGSEFPEWEEKKLGDVADIYDGVHQTPEYVSNGIKFVSVENIKSIYSTNKYITQEAFERDYRNNVPKKWDILMTRIGDVGRVALIDGDEQLAYYVSLALIRVSSNFIPQFFVQALRSNFFQAELWRNMLHTAYPKKINKQDIGKCKVKYPVSVVEQQKIADCLSSLDEVIAKQKATLAAWEEMKKGLLQQMFI